MREQWYVVYWVMILIKFNSTTDVGNDIGSRKDRVKVIMQMTLWNKIFWPRWDVNLYAVTSATFKPTARRTASVVSQSKDSDLLYTLVNGVEGDLDGDLGLSNLRSLRAHWSRKRCVKMGPLYPKGWLFILHGSRSTWIWVELILLNRWGYPWVYKAKLSARFRSPFLMGHSNPFYPLG